MGKKEMRFAVIDTSKWPVRNAKWPIVAQRLDGMRVYDARRVVVPTELDGSHCRTYVDTFLAGSLGAKEMRRIGIPFGDDLRERVLRVAGATVQAAQMVLDGSADDVAVVGAGAHHAHFDFGSGYCVFNDLTCCALMLSRAGKRVAIIDVDVHQGDGTIAIMNRHADHDVFLLDLSCKSNFPLQKQTPVRNGIVMHLEGKLQDDAYLELLKHGLKDVESQFGRPDVVLYQAGVDSLHCDRLGKLSLTLGGLLRRDQTVYEFAKRHGAHVISTCGGGYFDDDESQEAVVAAHVQQIRQLARYS